MPLNLTVFNQFTPSIKSAARKSSVIIWSRLGFVPGARISILKKKFFTLLNNRSEEKTVRLF